MLRSATRPVSRTSLLSIDSLFSILSIGSAGSILSIGSVGGLLRIGGRQHSENKRN